MKYPTAKDRARTALARDAAIALARLAGWTFALRPELLPPALRDHLYEPSAHLVLIASAGGKFADLAAAVRETRCIAVISEPGFTLTRLTTVYFTVIRCTRGRIDGHSALRLWVNDDGKLFLVPDPDGCNPRGRCFAVDRHGIEPANEPWTSVVEHGFGFGNADALMLAPKAPERR